MVAFLLEHLGQEISCWRLMTIFFELRIAILADVFVDGHARFLFVKG